MNTDKRKLVRFPEPEERALVLESRRTLKMARSAHAYVRGATAQFYQWLEQTDHGAVPAGPPVWICGDCHAGNLGPLANPNGKVRIQIRDLDQTVIGNPAHDLIRLGLSLATAARGSDLPGVTTAHMLEELILGYQEALRGHDESPDGAHAGKPVRAILEQATRRRWEHLARERLEQVQPQLPLGKRFWPLSPKEREAIEAMVGSDEAHDLVCKLHGRSSRQSVKVLDAAYWMKGCSSLGTLRYGVLLGIGGEASPRSYCLLDIKEAVHALAPASAEAHMPSDNAARVVSGAQALAPYLGERMLPTRLLGKAVVVRELMPQDLKLEIDQLSREDAVHAARFLASVVGHAHARQMPADTRARWARELDRHHSRTLDAPSWLWSTVVALIGRHEQAYLDHCRKFANSAA